MLSKLVLLGSSIRVFGWKKVAVAGSGLGLCSWVCYENHMYNKELMDRINYVMDHNIPLSGVRIQRRGAFPSWGFLSWLIPRKHLSLQFLDPETRKVVRQVGLGRSPDAKGWFDFSSEFVSHLDKQYRGLARFEQSIPIECCVDFKRLFGYYPGNIDVKTLIELSRTRIEPESKLPFYKTVYMKPIKINGKWWISTCETAIWVILLEEEKLRQRPLLTIKY